MKHYRVDKMRHTSVTDKARTGKEKFQDFDLAEFSKKTFSMFGGHWKQASHCRAGPCKEGI